MGLFRQLHKSAFWSQLLFGVVAILALPISQSITNTEKSPVQQTLTLNERVTHQKVNYGQVHFLRQGEASFQQIIQKSAICCQFIATSYRFARLSIPPIRAGPYI